MNTNDIETLVLLRQSGEITPADRDRLDAAVAADPAFAALVARLDRMTALARTPAGDTALPSFVRERILHEARTVARQTGRKAEREHRWSLGMRLAVAAGLALVLGLPVFWFAGATTRTPQVVLANAGSVPVSAPADLDDNALAAIIDDGLGADVDAVGLNLSAGTTGPDELAYATGDEDELLNQLASSLLLEQM